MCGKKTRDILWTSAAAFQAKKCHVLINTLITGLELQVETGDHSKTLPQQNKTYVIRPWPQ